ncbi:MAG TPA: SDR family oxidoreductase [Bryobacteraceae bacterium]|jgi:3-oxoacyl-[acyl-carrier protein] reductase|nr:SDR family oxidoreductase [Bryobacteraceae bacterium]
MELGIGGKVAVVAAASQGLGKASAQALAKEGARVAILSRRQEELDRVAHEIGAALPVACNLASATDIEAAIAKVAEKLGPVSILVNNCGGPPAGTFDTITEKQWEESFEQVFLSALRLTRAVLPMMRAAKWGRIVNIVSSSVEQPLPGLIVSNAFRPALAGWAKTLSAEVAADNILVTCVAPGRILTARTETLDRAASEKTGRPLDQIRQERVAAVPLKRYGTPEEFGAAVAFLTSDRASYLTGSVLRVDGGAVAGI